MSVVLQEQNRNRAASVPISEQNKIVVLLLEKIKTSGIFQNYEIIFNDLKTDKSNVGIMLLSGAVKNRIDVCGGYDAVIPFAIVLRTLGTVKESERINKLDLIDQMGMWFEENVVRDKTITGYTIYNVEQTSQSVVSYRDDSGIEDVSAEFKINYSKD